MEAIKSIAVIGGGNVAIHLIRAMLASQLPLKEIYARRPEQLSEFTSIEGLKLCDEIEDIESQVIFICVSDKAISEIGDRLKDSSSLIVHTSGSTTMQALSSKSTGVFYPLQTIVQSRSLDFKQVPIYLTANNENSLLLLDKIARTLSNNVKSVSDKQRQNLHLAAVISNNFINHLVVLTKKQLEDNGLEYEDVLPLLTETFNKLTLAPYNFTQTGPAVRQDMLILDRHIELLKNNINLENIYKTISKSIIDHENSK